MDLSAAMCSIEGLSSWPGSVSIRACSIPSMDTEFFDSQHYKLRPSGPHGSGAYFHARLNPKPCTSVIRVTSNDTGRTSDQTIGGHSYSEHWDSDKLYKGHIWGFGSTVYMFIAVYHRNGDVDCYELRSCTWWYTPGPGYICYLNTAMRYFRHDGEYPGISGEDFSKEDNYLVMFDKMMNHPPPNPVEGGTQTADLYGGRFVNPGEYEMDAINGVGLHMQSRSMNARYYWQLSTGTTIIPPQRPCFAYKLNERNVFDMICDLDVYLAPFASGMETAYLEAAKTLPQVSGNSIANLVELVQGIATLASIIKGKPRKLDLSAMPKNLDIKSVSTASFSNLGSNCEGVGKFLKNFKDPRDAWLYGRYCINTTEVDITEYRELIDRLVQLDAMCSETIQVFGQFQKGSVSYRATMVINLRDLVPKDLSEALRKAGFGMTLSNIWDMIPYSFVVDWFIGVSDVIGWAESIGNMLELSPSEIWYSVVTSYSGQTTYFRVPGRFLSNIPALVTNDPSNKTIGMRIADSIALFT